MEKTDDAFVLRGATAASSARSGMVRFLPKVGATTEKTDAADEGDRPDVACDGTGRAGAATTELTRVQAEQDRPDVDCGDSVGTRSCATGVLEDPRAEMQYDGRSFIESLLRRWRDLR